jgi:hypothetical protein
MTMDREQESFVSRRTILAAASAALAGTPLTATSRPSLAHGGPDAELLRLDREHDAAYARALRGSEGQAEEVYDEICETMSDVEFAIHRIPAQALAGLAVKARLASVYFEPDCGDALMMGIFTSLVEDILRMANATAKHPIALPYPKEA